MQASAATSLSHPRDGTGVALPFAAVVLAMLPAVLDQTILATGLPVIAADLGNIGDVSWVVTAYVVAAAAATPLWGKLGDRHGRKRLLEIALTGFVVTSALCAAAQDITQLIVLRLVQGTAAGGLMALAMAAVGDLVSPRERGRYQGYIAATFARRPRRRPARGRDELADARLHLGRGPLCVGLGPDPGPDRGDAGPRGDPRRARALRRGSDRAVPFAPHEDRRGRERSALPCDRGVVLDHGVRAALPPGDDGSDAHRGGTAARPRDARNYGFDHAVGTSHRAHGALQALPGRGPRADDRGARALGGDGRRALAGRHRYRARRLRAWLRHGHAGDDHRRPEQRRPARARDRDRDHRLLPCARRGGRRRGARRGLRVAGGRRGRGDRGRAGGVPGRRADCGPRAGSRTTSERGASQA